MDDSILDSVKKVLDVSKADTSFDRNIIMHINSVFSDLNQLGVGPIDGFMIENAESKWSEMLDDKLTLNNVKSYTYLKVKMLHDPPATSFHITAIEKLIRESEWRIVQTTSPRLPVVPDPNDPTGPIIIDGGAP